MEIIQLAGEVERKDIGRICYDSRNVVRNSIFVAIKGFKFDGHNYIMEAIAKGAKAIVLEDDSKVSNDYLIHQNVTKILVKDARKALAILSKNFFNDPSNRIKVIGVTGTNGKTSVTHFIKSILETAGKKTGLIGTIANYIGDKVLESEKTTPESVELNQLLNKMADEGCEYCVMEVSSHSLELHRVFGINFTAAIFTNLTPEHLDFHQTMDNYFLAKKKLFDALNEKSIALTNIDDDYGKKIIKDTRAKVLAYGSGENSDYRILNPSFNFNEVKFDLKVNDKIYSFSANVTGSFNVYNLTASIAICLELGIEPEIINNALKSLKQVPGRFQLVGDYPVKVIVDYAHTPDALENVLRTIHEILRSNNSNAKIITVFGAGGDRDRIKRPLMGKIVQALSDFIFVTSDNPRTENPQQIFDDILSGMNRDEGVFVIENREEAIKKAIELAKIGDVILLAGKGHETYQVIQDKQIPFDDKLIAEKYLIERFGK